MSLNSHSRMANDGQKHISHMYPSHPSDLYYPETRAPSTQYESPQYSAGKKCIFCLNTHITSSTTLESVLIFTFHFNSKSLPPPPRPPTLRPPPRSTFGSGHATLPRLVFQLLHLRTAVFQPIFPLRVLLPPRRTQAPSVPKPRPSPSVPSTRRVCPEESSAHGRPTPTVPKRRHLVPSRIWSGEIRLREL